MDAGGTVIINGPHGSYGQHRRALHVVIAGFVLILLTLFIMLEPDQFKSRSGRAIMAIRDNRIAAESVGINITKYKLMAFAISALQWQGQQVSLYAHEYILR